MAIVLALMSPATGYQCGCCVDPVPETLFLTNSEGTVPIVHGSAPSDFPWTNSWYGKQTIIRPRYTRAYRNAINNFCFGCGTLEEGPVEIEWVWPFGVDASGGQCSALALVHGVLRYIDPYTSLPCAAYYTGSWPPDPCEMLPVCFDGPPGILSWYGTGPDSCGPPMALSPSGAFFEPTGSGSCPPLETNFGPVLVQE